jgi:hypothetical protein
MNRTALLVITALITSLLSGCAAVSGRAAAKATSRSLQQLGNEEAQQYFGAFMRSPSVREAAQDIGESTGRGIAIVVSEEAPEILDEFASSHHSHRLMADLAATSARTIVGELDDAVDETLGPAAARAIRQDIGPAVVETFDGRLDPALAHTAGTISREVVRTMGTGIETELGPAVARAIRQDIGPAIADGIDAHLEDALARSARIVARESVIGTHEGLLELRKQPESLFDGALRFAVGTGQLVILAVGLLVGLLIGLLIQSRRNERRERARADERESTLLEVCRALRQQPTG